MITLTADLIGRGSSLTVTPDGVSNGHWAVRREAIDPPVTTAFRLARALDVDTHACRTIRTRKDKIAQQLKAILDAETEDVVYRRTTVCAEGAVRDPHGYRYQDAVLYVAPNGSVVGLLKECADGFGIESVRRTNIMVAGGWSERVLRVNDELIISPYSLDPMFYRDIDTAIDAARKDVYIPTEEMEL